MTPADLGAPELFRAVGLQPDGPAVLGRPVRAGGPGVYVVELPDAISSPPIDVTRVGRWIEQLPDLRLDGTGPTAKALAARLASFWLPSRRVLFIGRAETSIAGRLAALERHVLGERRPHAASQWLKTLRIDGLRVWWAATSAGEEYEDALFAAFAASVPPTEAAALPDPSVVLPWANLRGPGGVSRTHGITGAVPPAEPVVEAPPTRIVDLPPGDAVGLPASGRGTGTTRRAPAAPRKPAAERKPAAPRAPRAPAGRPADPVLLSADGLERLQSELAALLELRPGVVGRIRAAKELGDLKENSDYTAAREEQSFLEGRIQAIEAQLRAAVVVEQPAGDRVTIGSAVRVDEDGDEREYTIVGSTESDPSRGRISHQSPVGRALIGRSAGEEVAVSTPGGEFRLRVLAID